MDETIQSCLQQLSEDVSDLCLPLSGQVPELSEVPSATAFLRDWCAPNRPFVVRGAARQWCATSRWTPQHFRKMYGDKHVTVAVTPNGYADAISGDYFALPEERRMKMADFLDVLEEPSKHNGVFYIQKQNSNLTEELPELFADVPCDITWVTEALNRSPDAVNFWMGDGRAVTSLHKDHYENVYCVVRGHKDLILLPPTDRAWIPHRNCTTATYREVDGEFRLQPTESAAAVPWADLDPLRPEPALRGRLHPLRCRLEAGDLLYLPALWFHHLRQSHGCVAVNYWYDMEFDLKYCYFRLLERLSASAVGCRAAPTPSADR